MQKAYSTVDAVVDLVEFLVCETEAGGIADVEVGEYLKVDFGGQGFECWVWGGVRWRGVWIMLLTLRNGGIEMEEGNRGMLLTRHGCD
jgi:hypothetical protein